MFDTTDAFLWKLQTQEKGEKQGRILPMQNIQLVQKVCGT